MTLSIDSTPLADAVYRHAAETDGDKQFLETALGAFAALAPLVATLPPMYTTAFSAWTTPGSRRARIVGWQMGFASRPRTERFEFALAALRDPQEVVRRGAIAVLEREWSGRADVAPVLAEAV